MDRDKDLNQENCDSDRVLLSEIAEVDSNDFTASLAIISNISRTNFLFQRKDSTYPIEEMRGRLCLFGGAPNEGESPLLALQRELHEELNTSVISELINSIVQWRYFSALPTVSQPGTYSLVVSIASIEDTLFERFADEMTSGHVILEGEGVCLTYEGLKVRLAKPDSWAFSQDKVVAAFIENLNKVTPSEEDAS